MTTMDENVNWLELKHLLSLFSFNHEAHFGTSTFTSTIFNSLFQMYTLENNNTSPLCILCMLMPQIIPLRTRISVHT